MTSPWAKFNILAIPYTIVYPSAISAYTLPKLIPLIKWATKLINETPNQFAADGYDAIYTIKAAAEQAGITADMSNEEICTPNKSTTFLSSLGRMHVFCILPNMV